MRVVYDPAVVSYERLLGIFWNSHNPCLSSVSVQYRSAVFFESPEQELLALASRSREEKSRGRRVLTAVSPLDTFYPAEEYHQKYYLRSHGPLLEEISRLYPDFAELRATTLAARVNGHLGGNLTTAELAETLAALGLDRRDRERILEAAKRRH